MKASIRRQVQIQIEEGESTFTTFNDLIDGKEHIAISFGDLKNQTFPPIVRVHSECLTGDVFGSARCDCGPQMHEALRQISKDGGVLIYLRQEGRGIGLVKKLDAYGLQDQGFDTFEANRLLGSKDDEREFEVAAQMLQALGLNQIRLMTNNPEKVADLKKYGIDVVSTVLTGIHVTKQNRSYLIAKAVKAGHTMDLQLLRAEVVPANA